MAVGYRGSEPYHKSLGSETYSTRLPWSRWTNVIWGWVAVAWTGCEVCVVAGSGATADGSEGAIKSTGSPSCSPNSAKMRSTPVDASPGPIESPLNRDNQFADTGRTGWYLESGGKEMHVRCCGVTHDRFCNFSEDASFLRDGGLLASIKLDIEPGTGETSPCLVGASYTLLTTGVAARGHVVQLAATC